jgi:hypothetical protein
VRGAPAGVSSVDAQVARDPDRTPAPDADGWDAANILQRMGGANDELTRAVRGGANAVALLCFDLNQRVNATFSIEPDRVGDHDAIVTELSSLSQDVLTWTSGPDEASLARLAALGPLCVKFPNSEILRARVVADAKRRAGGTVMAPDAYAQMGGGFTTCGDFVGAINNGAQRATGIQLREQIRIGMIDKKSLERLRGMGVWTDGGPGIGTRPRPGDVFVHGTVDGNGGVTFQHMGIMTGIEVLPAPSTLERWKTVEGGAGDGNHISAGSPTYDPATNKLTTAGGLVRNLLGWIDLGKLAD